MQLKISRSIENRSKSQTYSVSLRLSEDGAGPRWTTTHIGNSTLEELARRWFLIHGGGRETDANQELCSRMPEWDDVTVQMLFDRPCVFSSPDLITILAIEQRTKRACELIAFIDLLETQLLAKPNQAVDLVWSPVFSGMLGHYRALPKKSPVAMKDRDLIDYHFK